MKKTKPKSEDSQKWKPEGLTMHLSWCGHGICCYAALAQNSDFPAGFIWVRLTSLKLDRAKKWMSVAYITDIYVPKRWRRMGIGTWMMKQLLEMYGILQTGTGTDEGGMALMKSMGWKQSKETGDWFLRGKPRPLAD